jgi:hypothetical protein
MHFQELGQPWLLLSFDRLTYIFYRGSPFQRNFRSAVIRVDLTKLQLS